MANMLQNKMLI